MMTKYLDQNKYKSLLNARKVQNPCLRWPVSFRSCVVFYLICEVLLWGLALSKWHFVWQTQRCMSGVTKWPVSTLSLVGATSLTPGMIDSPLTDCHTPALTEPGHGPGTQGWHPWTLNARSVSTSYTSHVYWFEKRKRKSKMPPENFFSKIKAQ